MALKDSKTPWAYRKGKGILYKTPAAIKLAFFFCFSLAVFLFDFYILLPAVLTIIIFAVNAGINPRELLRGGAPMIFLLIGITFFSALELKPIGFNADGLVSGILFVSRMIISFSAGALLFYTTTMNEIMKALSRAEGILNPGKKWISLGISLMLSFIPRFFEIWEESELAWKSRSPKKGFGKFIILVPVVMDRMIEKAAETAEALESRGFMII